MLLQLFGLPNVLLVTLQPTAEKVIPIQHYAVIFLVTQQWAHWIFFTIYEVWKQIIRPISFKV